MKLLRRLKGVYFPECFRSVTIKSLKKDGNDLILVELSVDMKNVERCCTRLTYPLNHEAQIKQMKTFDSYLLENTPYIHDGGR
jgi:hypothetical protein